MAVGNIFQYTLALEKLLGTDEYWHYLLLIVVIFKVPFYVFYRAIPESPIYLKKIGKIEEAKRTVIGLYRKKGDSQMAHGRHDQEASNRSDSEGRITKHCTKSKMETMDLRLSRNDTNINQTNLTEQDRTLTFKDIKYDPTLHKMLIYIIILCLGEVLTGQLIINLYSKRVIDTFNFSHMTSQLLTIVLAVVRLMATVVGSWATSRVNRKKASLIGYSGVLLANFMLFLLGYFYEHNGNDNGNDNDDKYNRTTLQIFQFIFISTGITFWAFGIQCLIFVIPNEISPAKYKAFTQRVIFVVMFMSLFLIGLIFPQLEELIGSYVFLIFSGCNVFMIVYVYFRMFESRNIASVDCFEIFQGRGYF